MIPSIQANKEIVKALMQRLVETFENFASEQAEKTEDGLSYIDALMGCHNFYKAIILDLEHRTKDKEKIIRSTAIGTLIEALENAPQSF